ncbi:MAG: hypothetical protein J6C96_12215 [Oscillospiraceae bacterium]|nr:hypothetical protein [Oscillospiraceae bacterium]
MSDFMSDDIFDTAGGGEPQKPYVPRFERDLQKAGGDLNALAEEKKSEKNNGFDEIASDVDVSGLSIGRDSVGVNSSNGLEIEIEVADEEYPDEDITVEPEIDEASIDYVYDDDGTYDYSSLDAISADSIVLDDMSVNVKLEEMRTEKSAAASSLKNRMMLDDLAMELDGSRPQIDDMSTEYAPSKKNAEDIISAKETLDRDEKELIKNRLKYEIESKPEGFNQKKSLEMYKKLMAEQHAKESKSGFLYLLVLAVFALGCTALEYFIDLNKAGTMPILDYVPIASLVFSLLMLVRSGGAKVLSTLYFILNTIVLIGPGLVLYAVNTDNVQNDDYLLRLVLFTVAIVFSAVVCFKLATSKKIDAYYSYNPKAEKQAEKQKQRRKE